MSFHLLFCVFMVLGVPKVGDWAAGVFRMISWFSLGTPKGTALGFFAIGNMAIWSIVRAVLVVALSVTDKLQMNEVPVRRALTLRARAVRAAELHGDAAGGRQVPHRRRLRGDAPPEGGGGDGGVDCIARVRRSGEQHTQSSAKCATRGVCDIQKAFATRIGVRSVCGSASQMPAPWSR